LAPKGSSVPSQRTILSICAFPRHESRINIIASLGVDENGCTRECRIDAMANCTGERLKLPQPRHLQLFAEDESSMACSAAMLFISDIAVKYKPSI
jgi:hypothetical protein